MRNNKWLWGMLAVTLVFGMALAGCDTPSGGDSNPSNPDEPKSRGDKTLTFTINNASSNPINSVEFYYADEIDGGLVAKKDDGIPTGETKEYVISGFGAYNTGEVPWRVEVIYLTETHRSKSGLATPSSSITLKLTNYSFTTDP